MRPSGVKYFQCWFEDWESAPSRQCSLAAQGLYYRLMPLLSRAPVGYAVDGEHEVKRLPAYLGIPPGQCRRLLAELLDVGMLIETDQGLAAPHMLARLADESSERVQNGSRPGTGQVQNGSRTGAGQVQNGSRTGTSRDPNGTRTGPEPVASAQSVGLVTSQSEGLASNKSEGLVKGQSVGLAKNNKSKGLVKGQSEGLAKNNKSKGLGKGQSAGLATGMVVQGKPRARPSGGNGAGDPGSPQQVAIQRIVACYDRVDSAIRPPPAALIGKWLSAYRKSVGTDVGEAVVLLERDLEALGGHVLQRGKAYVTSCVLARVEQGTCGKAQGRPARAEYRDERGTDHPETIEMFLSIDRKRAEIERQLALGKSHDELEV